MRNNERYLAFSPAVPQAFLVHSSEVRHKIVGQETSENHFETFNLERTGQRYLELAITKKKI